MLSANLTNKYDKANVKTGSGMSSDTGTKQVDFSTAFTSTPKVVVTPTSAGTPLYATVTDVTTSGFKLSIWGSSGARVAATFSYIAVV